MSRPKVRPTKHSLELMLDEASWLLSHAQALTDYGRHEEAALELARAAAREEEVACLLDSDGQELEAAIHRVSAAWCHERIGQFTRAVTLLRAALSVSLTGDYRDRVDLQLTRCLAQSLAELSQRVSMKTPKRLSAHP
jgi:hypothetical protein